MVLGCVTVARPRRREIRLDRNGEDVPAAGPQDTADLLHALHRILHVLERVGREHEVERPVGVRERHHVFLRVLGVGQVGKPAEHRMHPSDRIELDDAQRTEGILLDQAGDGRSTRAVEGDECIGDAAHAGARAALRAEEALAVDEPLRPRAGELRREHPAVADEARIVAADRAVALAIARAIAGRP